MLAKSIKAFIRIFWCATCWEVSGSSIAYIKPSDSVLLCILSTSALKKFKSIKRFTPLPRLLIGISSSPAIDTFLNKSDHFKSVKDGILGLRLFASSGFISRILFKVLFETSCNFVVTCSAIRWHIWATLSSLSIDFTASFKGSCISLSWSLLLRSAWNSEYTGRNFFKLSQIVFPSSFVTSISFSSKLRLSAKWFHIAARITAFLVWSSHSMSSLLNITLRSVIFLLNKSQQAGFVGCLALI